VAIRDAILISLVGMGVVFLGLLVTSWLISAISLVPAWAARRKRALPVPVPAGAGTGGKEAPQPVITPVPPPDAAAVIAALLEVEMRLYGGGRSDRFTFRRDPAAGDWKGDAGRRSGQSINGAR
jgi:Na+-transporting methylmalonyl-CoA/oxaloacetate decarboxylase gamma subunit